MHDEIPLYSADLIEYLEQLHPPISGREVLSGQRDTNALIAKAAQRSLVESLRERLTAQNAPEDY